MAVCNKGGDGEESEKVLGEMEDTGRKTGTCSVMKEQVQRVSTGSSLRRQWKEL